ncbi:hypothetical protein CLI72_07385 [Porphyromonas gingivalis]|nr:hypothetical protein CLI72_07385 [Porphyromonas gingivalis]
MLKLNGYGGRQAKVNEKRQCFKGGETLRDILGHVSIQTTEVYARADSKQKREALEKTYTSILPQEEDNKPSWESDSELKSWLKNLGR